MCYVTVGTGVGIGLIINGKTVHGVLHPEGGHVRVPHAKGDEDYEGSCPFHGDCIEGMCTNLSIKKRLGLKDVGEIPKLKDSHKIWDILAEYMGTFCSNIFLTTSVERIILGGGIFNRKCLLEKTRKVFKAKINRYIFHDKIKDL
jgi:fructokinase